MIVKCDKKGDRVVFHFIYTQVVIDMRQHQICIPRIIQKFSTPLLNIIQLADKRASEKLVLVFHFFGTYKYDKKLSFANLFLLAEERGGMWRS